MKRLGRNIERLLAAVTFAEAGEQDAAREMLRGNRSIAVAVVRGHHDVPQELIYAVNAARRNSARLDILVIDGSGAAEGDGDASLSFREKELVRAAAIPFRVIAGSGSAKEALVGHARREKDILFFVADPAGLGAGGRVPTAAAMNKFVEMLGRPVVQVDGVLKDGNINRQKERTMASTAGKTKPVGKMLVMGLISIALYTYLLTNQDLVNGTFGKGGWYALLPIIVAFVFSFVHGSFTGDFWTVLGIEAAKKKMEVK